MTSTSSPLPLKKKKTRTSSRQIYNYFHKEIRLIQQRSSDIVLAYLEKAMDDRVTLAEATKSTTPIYADTPHWWTRNMVKWFSDVRRKRMSRMEAEVLAIKKTPEPFRTATIQVKLRFFTKPLGHFTYSLPQTGDDVLPIHKNGVCMAMFHK